MGDEFREVTEDVKEDFTPTEELEEERERRYLGRYGRGSF